MPAACSRDLRQRLIKARYAGGALAAGRFGLAYQGLERLAVDAALIVGLGVIIVLVKQATVHRCRPMV